MNLAATPAEVAVGGFTATEDGWWYEGALTLDNAGVVYDAMQALPWPAAGSVDFAGLTHADSAALALILELHRRAGATNQPLRIAHLPASLSGLARVYGVADIVQAHVQ